MNFGKNYQIQQLLNTTGYGPRKIAKEWAKVIFIIFHRTYEYIRAYNLLIYKNFYNKDMKLQIRIFCV